MRSCRESPEPLSNTSSGKLSLRPSSQRVTASVACAVVAGGGYAVVASVRNNCLAITLFDSLLMSRTTSYSGGGLSVASGNAPDRRLPSRTRPVKLPPPGIPHYVEELRTKMG